TGAGRHSSGIALQMPWLQTEGPRHSASEMKLGSHEEPGGLRAVHFPFEQYASSVHSKGLHASPSFGCVLHVWSANEHHPAMHSSFSSQCCPFGRFGMQWCGKEKLRSQICPFMQSASVEHTPGSLQRPPLQMPAA